MSTRQDNLAALTGLRFVFAIHVFLFHVVGPTLPRGGSRGARIVASVIDGGYVGVSMFFVLSGFILAYVYLTPGPVPAMRGTRAEFWWARVARVYPVYLFGLLVAIPQFAIAALRGGVAEAGANLLALVGAPLALQSWAPTAACRWNCPGWSLSVEAFFYAVFPVVGMWLARMRRGPRLAAAVAAWLIGLAAPALYVLLGSAPAATTAAGATGAAADALRYLPPLHLGAFVVGIVVGLEFVERRPGGAPWWAPTVAATTFAALYALLGTADAVPYLLLHNGLLVPCGAALVYALAWQRGALAGALAHPLMVRLGEASYAFYLLHLPIFAYFLAVAARVPALRAVPAGVAAGGVLAASLALALWAARAIEEPARRAIRARAHARIVAPVPIRPALVDEIAT